MRGVLLPLLLIALQQGDDVRQQVTLEPDSVTIGEPFHLIVTVRAPLGSTVQFPQAADSASALRLLDPVQIVSSDSTGELVQSATYRMSAWHVDMERMSFPEVVVLTPTGDRRSLPVPVTSLTVSSVLPADSSQHVPQPARDIFRLLLPWWYPWVPLALLAVALLGLFRWWRARRVAAAAQLDPAVLAERDFIRIEALGLLDAGEHGRHVVLMLEVLKRFLSARIAGVSPALTSDELMDRIRSSDGLPADRVERVLRDAELIKFAPIAASSGRAHQLGKEMRAIVAAIGPVPATVRLDDEDPEVVAA